MPPKTEFLGYFYRQYLLWWLIGLPVSFVASGKEGILGFAMGAFSMAVIIGLWDLTLRATLKPRKTSAIWESLLVFIRYALLGGLFYAMISWFVLSWPWYFTGVTVILPSMLVSALLFRGSDQISDHED